MNALRAIWTNDDGQDLIEYALLAALVALAAVTTVTTLGSTINTTFQSVVTSLTSAT